MATFQTKEMLIRPIVTGVAKSLAPTLTPAATAVAHATATNLPPAFGILNGIRGGAAAATVFDMGLAKTRLEGLAYSTVTTLVMNGALRMFSSTPKKFKPVPDDETANGVRLNNALVLIFSLCMAVCVALGSYTTIAFTLMSIYSKTALGMGLKTEYLELFDKLAPYRVTGFRAFIGSLLTFNIGWYLSLVLNYEGEIRWVIALPALIIGIVGLMHFNTIMSIAGSVIYSAAS